MKTILLIAAFFVVCMSVGFHSFWQLNVKEQFGPESRKVLQITGSEVIVERRSYDEGGVYEIWANDWSDLSKGFGYVHTRDRAIQMFLLRSIVYGRLSETFAANNETLQIDKFMRLQGFGHYVKKSFEKLTPEGKSLLQSYADGVNHYLKEESLPFEFRLAGYKPEPWTPFDSLAVIRIMCYLGTAESQEYPEKFIVQSMREHHTFKLIQRIFSPLLDPSKDNKDGGILAALSGLTNETDSKKWREIIKQIRLEKTIIPSELPFIARAAPTIRASNNWIISAERSATNRSIYASDPHLNTAQLPAIWYEVIGHTKDNYVFGIGVPGVPGIVMGRTKYISWGFSYGFMDMMDYFVEHCKGETCKSDDKYVPINKRIEIIKRKDNLPPVNVTFYETSHGLLEVGDKYISKEGIKEGYYLSRAFTHYEEGAVATVNNFLKLLDQKTVKDAQKLLTNVDLSANFLINDINNNIGYQQSGLAPSRSHSGLSPLVGWDSNNDWNGRVPSSDHLSLYNPKEGIIATANDHWHNEDKALLVTANMGPYRSGRILELLQEKEKISVEDCKRIQGDLISIQARKYMKILAPVLAGLPESSFPSKKLLEEWNYSYDKESKGAYLFEKFYEKLFEEVYGKFYGVEAWHYIQTRIIQVFGFYFDNVIFDYKPEDNELLWHNETRDALFARIVNPLVTQKPENVPRYGDDRSVYMTNMFFGDTASFLTRLIGIDQKVVIEGSRSTVCQGQVGVINGRVTSFAPSWRFVTDIGTNIVESILPGGPSARFFSGLYIADLQRYFANEFKKIVIG